MYVCDDNQKVAMYLRESEGIWRGERENDIGILYLKN